MTFCKAYAIYKGMSERPPQLLAPNGEPFNSESEEEPRDLIIPGEDEPVENVDVKDLVIPGQEKPDDSAEPKEIVPHNYTEPQDPKDLVDHNEEPFNPESAAESPELVIPGRREIDPNAADKLILPGSPEFVEEMGGTHHNTYKDYNEAAGGEDRQTRETLQQQIDEADAMNRPTKRMRTLQAIAHEAADSGNLDLAIEAASRIRTSKVRKQRSLSQLWIRNTLAHDQVMRDIADKVDQPHRKLEVAENIRFGYKRNPVIGAVIDSAYEGAEESLGQIDKADKAAKKSEEETEKGWHLMESAQTEDRARELKKQAGDIDEEAGEKLREPNEDDELETDSREAHRAKLKKIAKLDSEARKLRKEAKELFNSSDDQYEEAQARAAQGWHLMGAAHSENKARDLEQRAVELTGEKIRGLGASKYFGEAVVRRALFKKDPEVLAALGGVRHFLRKRRAKETIEGIKKQEEQRKKEAEEKQASKS